MLSNPVSEIIRSVHVLPEPTFIIARIVDRVSRILSAVLQHRRLSAAEVQLLMLICLFHHMMLLLLLSVDVGSWRSVVVVV